MRSALANIEVVIKFVEVRHVVDVSPLLPADTVGSPVVCVSILSCTAFFPVLSFCLNRLGIAT